MKASLTFRGTESYLYILTMNPNAVELLLSLKKAEHFEVERDMNLSYSCLLWIWPAKGTVDDMETHSHFKHRKRPIVLMPGSIWSWMLCVSVCVPPVPGPSFLTSTLPATLLLQYIPAPDPGQSTSHPTGVLLKTLHKEPTTWSSPQGWWIPSR